MERHRLKYSSYRTPGLFVPNTEKAYVSPKRERDVRDRAVLGILPTTSYNAGLGDVVGLACVYLDSRPKHAYLYPSNSNEHRLNLIPEFLATLEGGGRDPGQHHTYLFGR